MESLAWVWQLRIQVCWDEETAFGSETLSRIIKKKVGKKSPKTGTFSAGRDAKIRGSTKTEECRSDWDG